MDEYNERLVKLEERYKSNTHRIENLEKLSECINRQNENIAELVVELKHTNEHLKSQDERLDEMEKIPKSRTETAITAVITSLFAGVVGYLLSQLF